MARRATAAVNLAAIERNARRLVTQLQPGTRLCAVVKADGYGHGAVPAARAALRGGASDLAVATTDEAVELRVAGITAPILILGAVSDEELPDAIAADAALPAWDQEFVEQLAIASRSAGKQVKVHVKLDTGLGRLGTRDTAQALDVARSILAAGPALILAGAMTHFATADDDQRFVARQLAAFEPFLQQLATLAGDVEGFTVHASNSAATLLTPHAHYDMVRAGIALYGADPMNLNPDLHGLEPALALRSYVAAVKVAQPGESAGYGRRFIADQETHIATLPIGYGDGLPRAFADNLDVLIGGVRYPLCGMVSMDNITIDVGAVTTVRVGDEATIIGVDGEQRQTAEDLARRLNTINYEVLCGISKRVPRTYHRDGDPE